jgi:hypothetical protein
MAKLIIEHKFDPTRNRHYLNGQVAVLHCHHYASLFTQLGIDAKEIVDGTKILRESSEDVFHKMLSAYFQKNGISDPAERIDIGRQLFSAMGLGLMEVTSASDKGGDIVLKHSHVDEGWIKKWGKYKSAVNFLGAGYIEAMFAAAYNKPLRTYKTSETQSIVTGATQSMFKVQS